LLALGKGLVLGKLGDTDVFFAAIASLDRHVMVGQEVGSGKEEALSFLDGRVFSVGRRVVVNIGIGGVFEGLEGCGLVESDFF
jgi:hypothetical protein